MVKETEAAIVGRRRCHLAAEKRLDTDRGRRQDELKIVAQARLGGAAGVADHPAARLDPAFGRFVDFNQALARKICLDALEQLRDGLLSGSLPVATLRNLERMVAQERALVSDPKLNAVLDDIELRAAVELAKLEMSGMRG
ncbi:MAG: hypothetical protein EBT83_16285 [Betaproteobacteria bacterium]|nr:hypothetical protein [Betaproteobacteria bacterium]